MKKYIYGIDIGGTSIKMGLFSLAGELVDSFEIPTRTESNGELILKDLCNGITEDMDKRSIAKEEVLGVGIGVPGPVKQMSEVLKCVNLGWQKKNVKQIVETVLDLKTFIGNDANVAALGEKWQGGGKGHDNLVLVTLGTGVGGGIIVEGHMIEGFNAAGGEIGHIKMNAEEKATCGCGKKGCLEQYASATGFVNIAKGLLEKEKDVVSSLRDIDISAKAVLDAAKEGDILAVKAVDKACDMLGKALANISCVCDPEVYVIGGGVSKAGQYLIDKIKGFYNDYTFSDNSATEFRLATLGNDAGMYGSAKMVVDEIIEKQ